MSDRLSKMLEMLQEISRQTDPNDAVLAFSQQIREISPMDGVIAASVRGMDGGAYKITRRSQIVLPTSAFPEVHDDGSPGVHGPNPWEEWDRLPVLSGGFLGDVIAGGRPQLFEHLEVSNDPILGDSIATMGSCIAVPVFDGGRVLNWLFVFRSDPDGFAQGDLENQVLITNLFGAMTRNLVSAREAAQLNRALHAQFEEVARVQQSLLPKRNPVIPGVTIATSYLTSEQAGGDYYDFFQLPEGRWGILIADVSGHGAGAATIMAMLHAILHGYHGLHEGPARVMRHANERLMAAQMEPSFVTAIFAVYDPATRELSFTRAGHPPARVKDTRTGDVRLLEGGASLPIGIVEEYEPEETSVRLEPGETVIFYTDGITEEFSSDRTMFGPERLDHALTECSGQPDCVVDSVHAALYRHTGRRDRQDDQTLVVMHVHEESASDV